MRFRSHLTIFLAATAGWVAFWVAGLPEGLLALEDKGGALVPTETAFKRRPESQIDWNRLSVDYARNGLLATVGRDNSARLWKSDGSQLVKFEGFTDIPSRVVFSHDGVIRYMGTVGKPRPFGWSNDYFFYQPELEAHLREGFAGLDSVELRLGASFTGLEIGRAHV